MQQRSLKLGIQGERWIHLIRQLGKRKNFMKRKKSTFGRDYFLEDLPIEKGVKKIKKGDVKVDKDMLSHLKSLGLIKGK